MGRIKRGEGVKGALAMVVVGGMAAGEITEYAGKRYRCKYNITLKSSTVCPGSSDPT